MQDVLNQVNLYFEKHLKNAPKEKQELFLRRYEDIARKFKEEICLDFNTAKISLEDT